MQTTIEELRQAVEKCGAQGVTIFANGAGYVVAKRFSAPSFKSLPQLSKFVEEVLHGRMPPDQQGGPS